MRPWFQFTQIPLPFGEISLVRENYNQPKWTKCVQWQACDRFRDLVCGRGMYQPEDEFASANYIRQRFTSDAVPIDQRKADSGVVNRDPRSAVWFTRQNDACLFELPDFRRERGNTGSFFVPIHGYDKPAGGWRERNSTHQLAHG
jgi:hypothetical protein